MIMIKTASLQMQLLYNPPLNNHKNVNRKICCFVKLLLSNISKQDLTNCYFFFTATNRKLDSAEVDIYSIHSQLFCILDVFSCTLVNLLHWGQKL